MIVRVNLGNYGKVKLLGELALLCHLTDIASEDYDVAGSRADLLVLNQGDASDTTSVSSSEHISTEIFTCFTRAGVNLAL